MKNETIVDRVVERLKAQPLGDLITEEDLHDIVKQAIPKTFFEKRLLSVDRFGDKKETEPVIFEIMRELMRDSANKAVQAWVAQNGEIIAEYWKKVLDEGLLKYVQRLQDERATADIRMVLGTMIQRINEERNKAGLPWISL